ncbi:MAG: heterodisulfide reductase-related iron-sulfur binding cluster [bacterium]|nr:heterodisulfide reductase-related iron-sulfur binding cluster [bacterium]
MLHNIDPESLGPRGEAMAAAVGKCVHCGFCLPACPTYQELESEMDSPRGRILLMKSVLEGSLEEEQAQPHIDRCLGCLACVTHCPSGVEYGELITSYRSHVEDHQHRRRFSLRDCLMRWTLPYANRFRWAVRMGKLTRPLARFAPKSLQPMLDLVPEDLPPSSPLPEFSPAVGQRRGSVAMLVGCAQQVLAPDINASAVRVLNRNGYDVILPRNQGCCGALAWHTGEGQLASKFARQLIETVPQDVDAMLTTAAGCGSAISEYPLLLAGSKWEAAAKQLADRTMDISVFLDRIDLQPIPGLDRPKRIAYHDACHLAHAQKVRAEPRRLLRRIPGLQLVEIADADTCCGSAGTYNIEQPEIAGRLGARKATNVLATRASAVVTGNIGCLVQIEKHLKEQGAEVPVLHTVQVLDRAYRKNLS